MPPKNHFKSFARGLRSMLSPGPRGDERPIAHDPPTAEDFQPPSPTEKPEDSTATPAIPVTTAEHPSHPDVGPSTGASAQINSLPMEHPLSISILPNSQGFNVENMHMINIGSAQHVHHVQGNRIDGWKMLSDNIASNALHDSNARFDPPKCDEDTRVELTNELMDWMQARDAPQRLLCMTGAAGAGKSALQQTVAERCSSSNILGSAFFFSTGDPTRNNLTRIVPTIAYQLALQNPALRDAIGKVIEEDLLIFKKQTKTQMDKLVVTPTKRLCASGELDRNTFRHAILIDGLDECSGEENQAELLSTIKHCLLDNDLPFRIFITSRPEWTIRSALEPEPKGYLHQLAYHIKLSDMYDATSDIRRYLWNRLRGIGSRSGDRRALPHLWPTQEDIEKLVAAASGQFIYAATVVKYVSERHTSPVVRLQKIMSWTPEAAQQTQPFERLDILYRSILSTAKELYEAADTNQGRDFVLLVRAHQLNSDGRVGVRNSTRNFDEIIGLEEGGNHILFSDLHSMIFFDQSREFTEEWQEIRFYHKSFTDVLDSELRSQHLFISERRVRQYVGDSCLRKLLQHEDFLDEFSFPRIIRALLHYKPTYINDLGLVDFTRNEGWRRIDKRLSSNVEIFDLINWFDLAQFTFDAIQCLRDDLHEHELADIVKSYFNDWKERYKSYGFSEKIQ